MTEFQLVAPSLTAAWLVAVVVWFQRSTPVLLGGLLTLGIVTLGVFLLGAVSLGELGLGIPASWLTTVALAAAWCAAMFAFSPLADWLASRWFSEPPTLQAFRAIQQSKAKLVGGIVVAWALGGVLEELIFRGIVLRALETALSSSLGVPIAAAIAVFVAAVAAGAMHLYQGKRAALIVTQLSVLFGVLFVVSGHNLWAVMLCHGFYDTIAFIRFANKQSKYSNLDG